MLNPKPITFKKQPSTTEISMDALVRELLDSRRKDRRTNIVRSSVLMLIALLYLGMFMYMYVIPGWTESPEPDSAAVVRLSGVIGPTGVSLESLDKQLTSAFESPKTTGVILDINSPGGTPVQSSLIHDRIVELKKLHKKTVVAVAGDTMASGAYFIAAAADQIVVNPSSVVGSIGVINASFGFDQLMEKAGVERRVTTAGNSKSMLDPFKPVQPEQQAKLRSLLSGIHGQFIKAVKEGRGERLKLDTPGLFEGSIWTGEEAVRIGMADDLGSIRSAAQKYLGTEKLSRFEAPAPILEKLFSRAGRGLTKLMVEQAVTANPQLLLD